MATRASKRGLAERVTFAIRPDERELLRKTACEADLSEAQLIRRGVRLAIAQARENGNGSSDH